MQSLYSHLDSPHNAAHATSHQPFAPFGQTQPSALDNPAFDMLSAPHVAKQMAALSAASQARIAQNQNQNQKGPALNNGTSSGSFLGGINMNMGMTNTNNNNNNNANASSASANGVGFAEELRDSFLTAPNNRALAQTPHSATNSFPDHLMSSARIHQQTHNATAKQRQLAFIHQIATIHSRRGHPLPPQFTGLPNPSYDPTTTSWNLIDPSQEVGSFVLAGKDIDLFRLWSLVLSNGGSQTVINAGAWSSFLPHFDLPEEFTSPNGNTVAVAPLLYQIYMQLLGPFEDSYKKNLVEQQKKATTSQRPGGMPGAQFAPPPNLGRPHGIPNMQQAGMRPPMNANGVMSQHIPPPNGLPYNPMHTQHRSASTQNIHQISAPDSHIPPIDGIPHTVDSNLLDQDMQGIKRKHEQTEGDMKRVRQKTEPPEPQSISMLPDDSTSLPAVNGVARPRQQAARRKIEYVPLKREVDSVGGRDLRMIEQEYNSLLIRRPMRELNDWGTLDLECLCMSIRSRLSVELSYALSTFCILSTMKGQGQNTGFPISNCPDLLDDSLDLVEELAFGEPEKKSTPVPMDTPRSFTNKELVSHVQDTQGQPFASLRPHQGAKDPNLGPMHRPADIIILVVDIIRNLTAVDNNTEYLAKHPRVMDILLRLCCLEQLNGQGPTPVSKALSLFDLLYIRREVLNIIVGVGREMRVSENTTPATLRTTRRIVDLAASYLVDPTESISPFESIQIAGVSQSQYRRPSALTDVALEAFTKFSTQDENRPIIAQVTPSSTLSLMLERLLHRLPVTDIDFQLMQREQWAVHIERIVMAIYTILFVAPWELKQQIKADRALAFKHVMLRVAHRVLQHEGRCGFVGRRTIEAIKLLDTTHEESTSAEQHAPALAFGMGFDEGGDAGQEKGTGMLGGNRDLTWEMMFMREVVGDDVVFGELDSLQRVECS